MPNALCNYERERRWTKTEWELPQRGINTGIWNLAKGKRNAVIAKKEWQIKMKGIINKYEGNGNLTKGTRIDLGD